MSDEISIRHPLKERDYLLFWLSRMASILGTSALSATVAWQVYEISRLTHTIEEAAWNVGMIGLSQFGAQFLLTIPAGIWVDRSDRKLILSMVLIAMVGVAIGFLLYSMQPEPSFWGFFALSGLIGAIRAFSGPAGAALAPMLVSKAQLPKAIAVNGIAFQAGLIIGPGLGGLLIGISVLWAYGTSAALCLIASLLVMLIRTDTKTEPPTTSKMAMLKEGIAYVWHQKIVFGALSLDLFAVLLGGATALLPIFAKDILFVGASEFGLLRASPAIGAMVTSIVLSINPIRRHAGRWMFAAVGIFGLCTIAFGLSNLFWVSVLCMIVLGMADMISVFVRGSIVQIVTPDAMRGRVSAVSGLFIGASNELGEFESGVATRFLGPVGAALFGGIGSLLVTMGWIKLFPELYHADKLE